MACDSGDDWRGILESPPDCAFLFTWGPLNCNYVHIKAARVSKNRMDIAAWTPAITDWVISAVKSIGRALLERRNFQMSWKTFAVSAQATENILRICNIKDSALSEATA